MCVNTARGALYSFGIVVDGCRAENQPLVNRFMRRVFNLRMLQLRFTDAWDVKLCDRNYGPCSPYMNLPLGT